MNGPSLRILTGLPVFGRLFAALELRRRYIRVIGQPPNLLRPRTYSEKLTHLVAFDRDPRLKILCDKIAAKDFIAARVGPAHNVPLLGVWDKPEDIDWNRLPARFVLKPNHACKQVALVRDAAGRDPARLVAAAREWLATDYFDRTCEWGYRDLPRRLLAEPLLRPAAGSTALEAQLFTFGGRTALIRLMTGERGTASLAECWFDARGRRLAVTKKGKPVPATLDDDCRQRLVELAGRLSAGFRHLRVDFYLTDDGIRVGELTPYTSGGRPLFKPASIDGTLGRFWDGDFDWDSLPPASPSAGAAMAD